jgi:hypothetical protein
MRRLVLLSTLLVALASSRGNAQSGVIAPPANDSVFRRARRLVSEGNGAAGRALVDSLLKRETEGTTTYGDALYWRGALAETAAEAERDYRRVIVEYPLSYYSDDALLDIARLEQARGDRDGALQHMLRFVREHPVSQARGVAALAAARLAFEQRDTKTGCSMITEARASVLATDVETRNQINYFGSRCSPAALAADAAAASQVATVPPPPVRDSTPPKKVVTDVATKATPPSPTQSAALEKIGKSKTPPVAKATPDKTPEKSTTQPVAVSIPVPAPVAQVAIVTPPPTPAPTPPAKVRGNYTIQLAAFNTQDEAEKLVAKLATRNVMARVSGSAKPFRVRLDFYLTHQAAQEEVASLKQKGIIGFVTTEEPPPEGKTP